MLFGLQIEYYTNIHLQNWQGKREIKNQTSLKQFQLNEWFYKTASISNDFMENTPYICQLQIISNQSESGKNKDWAVTYENSMQF